MHTRSVRLAFVAFLMCAMGLLPSAADDPGEVEPAGDQVILSEDELEQVRNAPRTVVFVCDASDLIVDRFDEMRGELSKALDGLRPVQSAGVVLFQGGKARDTGEHLIPATPKNKKWIEAFIGDVEAGGSSDPIAALRQGLGMKPQLLYLLAAGPFPDPDAVSAEVRTLNAKNSVRINTIAFLSGEDADAAKAGAGAEPEYIKRLRTIAGENGGHFNVVSVDELSDEPTTAPSKAERDAGNN